MKLQVLVTTMYQNNFNLFESMNLRSDTLIANQSNSNEYKEKVINEHLVQMITTDTRGLSRNRNIALALSAQNADLLMFSDDDLVFSEGYEQSVIKEFESHPEAEAIKFNLHDLSATRKISMKPIERYEKATRLNMSASGVCGLVIKRETIIKNNLRFREDFGAGTPNKSGEDTIFIMELLEKTVPLFRSPIDIAGIDQTESCWYKGYDDRFFQTAGKVLGISFSKFAYLLAIRSAYRFTRKDNCNFGFSRILKNYYIGIRNRET